MALKAGYNGVKKSILGKLIQMSNALIIKSLGTALSLTDAGELRVRNASDSHSGVVQPDGETTFIENGLLKSAGTSFVIEQIYYNNGDPATASTNVQLLEGKSFSDYDAIIIDYGQSGDGGVSQYNSQREFYLADPIFVATKKIGFGDFGKRSMTVTFDLDNDTFNYTSSTEGEQAAYKPLVYGMCGVKF